MGRVARRRSSGATRSRAPTDGARGPSRSSSLMACRSVSSSSTSRRRVERRAGESSRRTRTAGTGTSDSPRLRAARAHTGGLMRIVDAQIHLWGSGLPSNMAHRQVTSFATEEAVGLMDEGGVDAAVIHPPGWDPGSTEMAFKAVRDFPGRFAILGAFPLSSPDKLARVEKWRSQPGMLGLRYGFLHEP